MITVNCNWFYFVKFEDHKYRYLDICEYKRLLRYKPPKKMSDKEFLTNVLEVITPVFVACAVKYGVSLESLLGENSDCWELPSSFWPTIRDTIGEGLKKRGFQETIYPKAPQFEFKMPDKRTYLSDYLALVIKAASRKGNK